MSKRPGTRAREKTQKLSNQLQISAVAAGVRCCECTVYLSGSGGQSRIEKGGRKRALMYRLSLGLSEENYVS